jgi:hypothetical protein
MSPGGSSDNPESRARSLANLRDGPAAPLGNRYTVKHGVYATIAEAELEAKTREIFDALAADAPVRAADGGLPAHDALAVRMLADALIRRERALAEEAHGLEVTSGPNKGKLRGVVEFGLRLDSQVLDLLRELGLTPLARAKLLGQLDPGRGKKRSALDDFIHGEPKE